MADNDINVNGRESLDRRRAEHAYQFLKEIADDDLERLKSLCTRAEGLPIALRSQGLTIVLATLLKEEKRESRKLAAQLAEWVSRDSGLFKAVPGSTATDLLEYSITASRSDYLAMQSEALAYLEHVKRLAGALEKSYESGS